MSKARELAELSRTVSDSADAVAITIDASENVTFANDITVTGNTGIGGAAHSSDALNITSTNQHIRLNNGSELGILALTSGGDLDFWAHGADEKINFRTGTGSGTVAMNVVGTNVGFGTSNPVSLIDATGAPQATSGSIVRVRNTSATASNTSFGGVLFTSSPGTDFSIGKSNVNAATSLSFRNGNTGANLMELDHSGNLLVGTTSTIPFLSSSATGAGFTSTGTLMAAATAEAGLFNRIGSNGTIVDFRKSGTVKGRIGTDGSDIFIGSDDTNILFQSGGVLPANSVGGVRDNAFALGSSSARYTDLYLSGGAYLGGTAAANKLDDYEEGTFTINVNGASGINTTAYYVKIGNKVNIQYYTGGSTFTAVQASFTGLPFTTASGAANYGSFFSAHNTATTNATSGYFSLNSTIAYFVTQNSTTTPNYNAGSHYFMVSGHYFTD